MLATALMPVEAGDAARRLRAAGDDASILPDDPGRIAKLVHEHRVMEGPCPIRAQEVLELAQDLQEVSVRTAFEVHLRPRSAPTPDFTSVTLPQASPCGGERVVQR